MSLARESLADIARALEAGELEQAGHLLQEARNREPGNVNVRLFDAVLAQRRGRPAEAVAELEVLARELPQSHQVAFQLANALKACGRLDAAAAHYGRTIALQPRHADAAYNLGTCLAKGDPAKAGPWFVRALRTDFRLHDGYMQLLRCASDASAVAPPALRHRHAAADELVSVVTCSIRPERLARLRESCGTALAGGPWELVHIDDARSLCEGYTRGVAAAKGDILVLCHDDVRLVAPDFRARLAGYLEHFDLVGPAGTTRLTGPSVFWSGPPHAHNWVMYPGRREGTVRVQLSSPLGPVVPHTQALDGLLFAGRRQVFEKIGFDAVNFDGFHHYDVDFSYRAFRAGLRLATCQDLLVEHASEGSFDERWRHYAGVFQRKFPELARTPFVQEPTSYQLPDVDEPRAVAMLGWIDHWHRQVNAVEARASDAA